MPLFRLILRLMLVIGGVSLAGAAVDLIEPLSNNQPAFPLVAKGQAACIVLPAETPEVVRLAANEVASDLEAMTGARPALVARPPTDALTPRIEARLDPQLASHWEAYRLEATENTLMVYGADRRGLAYGLLEISRRVGVSPWVWWADVPVPQRAEVHLSLGETPMIKPAVRYRGIFLNDEGWGLRPWARHTYEPDVGNIGPRTYAQIFALLLRLRANTVWPAMHPGTRPFHQVPGNAEVARAYDIVVGSSHAEPLLRNNVGEWEKEEQAYNYLTHRDEVLQYWSSRVAERKNTESLFTLGMRGIHDSPMLGPKNESERISLLTEILKDQRALLAQHLGTHDRRQVAQIFCPYKEVLADYLAGLQVPDDVTLVWPDDNFGYIRRFGTPTERARSGGLGVYYHLSYLGAPLSWLWLDSLPPALIWFEMARAYQQGAKTLWMANVGDLKGNERSTEYFLNLAWEVEASQPDHAANYLRFVAARDFGESRAETIASLWEEHVKLATARKPEHLQWNLPLTHYRPTALNEREIRERLAAYASLVSELEETAKNVPLARQSAFFQLVEYPLASAAAANERYFWAELARVQHARGDPRAGETFAKSAAAEERIQELTFYYNHTLQKGKWRHIVMPNGLSPRDWRRFQPDPALPPPSSFGQAGVAAAEPPPPSQPLFSPAGARPGDFVDRDGFVSLHAGNFTQRMDAPDGGGWRTVPGLGRTGNAVTIWPSTCEFTDTQPPSLSYRFHVTRAASAKIRLRLLPTFPLRSAVGLRLRVGIDSNPEQGLTITEGMEPGSDAWKERVLSNAIDAELPIEEALTAGWHTLHLRGVDAGVAVDKIIIDLGGEDHSYHGPDETRLPSVENG